MISSVNLGIDCAGELKKIKTSSAYNEILCRHLFNKIPLILVSCLIAAAKGSIARANNRGLRGQPCLVPRSMLKLLDRSPFVFTAERGDVYKI